MNRFPYINNPFGFVLPKQKPFLHKKIKNFYDFSEYSILFLLTIKKEIEGVIGNCRVLVFGSRIKGNWDENSDWDIMVYSNPITEKTKTILKNKMSLKKVDVSFKILTDKPLQGIEIKN